MVLLGPELRFRTQFAILAGPHSTQNAFSSARIETIWRDSSELSPSGGVTSEDIARFAYAIFATDAFGEEARSLFLETPILANGGHPVRLRLARGARRERRDGMVRSRRRGKRRECKRFY